MQSGLVFGYVGLVDGLCERMRAELGFEVRVVATGGLAPSSPPSPRSSTRSTSSSRWRGCRIIYAKERGR